jgi:hypothetical protein
MAHFTNLLLSVAFLFGTACASQPQPQQQEHSQPQEQSQPAHAPRTVAPAEVEKPKPAEKPAVEARKIEPEMPKEQTWHMKKGKLIGPGKSPSPKVIGKVENKKGGGFTIDYCSDFGDFSIFESKSTKEVGSAEIIIRRKGHDPLCKDDFKGPYTNLKIREGSFAGLADGIIVTEGADVGEGVVESQLFSLEDGREIYRVVHNPDEEYTIKKNGKKVSAVFYAKATVKCELPTEGGECWKHVLEDNKIPKSVKMPDCAAAFKKAGKDIKEPAQVTARARVADISIPKIEFISGSATCAPEP